MTESRENAPMPAWLLPGLGLLVIVLFFISLGVGTMPLPLSGTLAALFRGESSLETLLLLELRLPRALLGLLVGASLGLAGAAMQGFLRNPLAEPGVIGVSSCAAFGAVLAFYSGLSLTFPLALPLGGIGGAFLSVLLLHLLAGREASTLSIILAGVAINAFSAALTSLVLNFAPNPYAALEIIFWIMGSLADRSMEHVQLVAPIMLLGWLLLLASGRGLDALTLGEDTAASLGIDLGYLRLKLIVGTALAVGAAVAVSGAIGFVGLVVPHLLRPLVGQQPARLLPASALGGAALLLAADLLVRLLPTGPELKLGVVTALVGAPIFLLLLHRLRREMAE
ncbi:FecCD family ABC transporter permease [Aquibaculum sediminis]|uniref:FecCD family ABC transporter permease n=1 Tax=Aquibaculum sediminis TaxID=3231907 RepID=UPI0034565505